MARKSISRPYGFDFLLQEIQKKNVIPIIGAGLSMSAEANRGGKRSRVMPDHRTLLHQLLKNSNIESPITRQSIELRLQAGDDDAIAKAASELREEMGDFFYSGIRDILEPIDIELLPSVAHDFLRILNFPYILTTNYDRLLERFVAPNHEVVTPKDLVAFNLFDIDRHRQRRSYILKLHGDITRPDTIPFGGAELLSHYGMNSRGEIEDPHNRLFHFMAQLFIHSTLLFVGVSLSDTEAYLQILDQIRRRRDWLLQGRHFAVVPYDQTREKLRKDLKKKMNIEFVVYEPDDDSHSQVWEFLSWLKTGRPIQEPASRETWEQWYLDEERPDYLQRQLSREKNATSVYYLTPTLTNALATDRHLQISCRANLEKKRGADHPLVPIVLDQMTYRADNLRRRLREEHLEVRVLFLETEFLRSLDLKVRSRQEVEIAIERYNSVLDLLDEGVDLEVRMIPGLTDEELKKRRDSFALIFNCESGNPLADVTVAYSTQATKEDPEIHMIHINTDEVSQRLSDFEKFWAAAINEEKSMKLISSAVKRATKKLSKVRA